MYNTYKKTVGRLESLGSVAVLEDLGSANSASAKFIDGFSQTTRETNRLVEIMDIQDELGIVDSILAAQKDVLTKLQQQISSRGHGEKKTKQQKTDGPVLPEVTAYTPTLRSCSRVQEAIRIVEDNARAVTEMINSAKRVQEDVSWANTRR
jgi:hypothetical protein